MDIEMEDNQMCTADADLIAAAHRHELFLEEDIEAYRHAAWEILAYGGDIEEISTEYWFFHPETEC